jgi:hypothetical protein
MAGIYPNKMVPDGDKVVVSGMAGGSNFQPQGPATIDMLVQEPVTVDGSGQIVSGGATGKIEGVKINLNGSTDFSITVPSNMDPGTFTPGGQIVVCTTMKDPKGNTIASDTVIRRMEGGRDPFGLDISMLQAFNDGGMAFNLAGVEG